METIDKTKERTISINLTEELQDFGIDRSTHVLMHTDHAFSDEGFVFEMTFRKTPTPEDLPSDDEEE